MSKQFLPPSWNDSNWPAVLAFTSLAVFLMIVGLGKFLGGDAEDEKPVEPPKKKLDIGSTAAPPKPERPS
jgi:hypothetical protein